MNPIDLNLVGNFAVAAERLATIAWSDQKAGRKSSRTGSQLLQMINVVDWRRGQKRMISTIYNTARWTISLNEGLYFGGGE